MGWEQQLFNKQWQIGVLLNEPDIWRGLCLVAGATLSRSHPQELCYGTAHTLVKFGSQGH